MSTLFNIEQIFKQGLLKNSKGEPWKSRTTVMRIVNKLDYVIIESPSGTSKCLTKEQIEEHNKHT